MPKDRARDSRRKFKDVGSLQRMGEALGWKREESVWSDNLQANDGQAWPQNAVKESRPHDNSSINKYHGGDWRKDRNEVYNVGGGHVKEAYDDNTYKIGK
jgi:hypothetical protein